MHLFQCFVAEDHFFGLNLSHIASLGGKVNVLNPDLNVPLRE